MADKTISPIPSDMPSFDEFKVTILEQKTTTGVLSQVANWHGKLPSIVRVLNNLDPTGIAGALDQLFSDQRAADDQDKILHGIYDLAVVVWGMQIATQPNLTDERFKFLYLVYVKSETNPFTAANMSYIQDQLDLPQLRVISIGEFLHRHGLIDFTNWYVGARIKHSGIVQVEADLLGNRSLPDYVSPDEIERLNERIRCRIRVLRELYRESESNTFAHIPHAELADKSQLDHYLVVTQLLPYMEAEGWIIGRTADTVSITEEGIDMAIRARVLS